MNEKLKSPNAETGNEAPSGLIYGQVLDQIKKDHQLKGSSASTLTVSLSVATKFLTLNGKELDDQADPDFFCELAEKLAHPESQTTKILFAKTVDSSYLARVGALVTAHKELTGELFQEMLGNLMANTSLTKKEIADRTGISAGILNSLSRGQPTGAPSQAKIQKLDEILGGDGQLAAAYAAKIPYKPAENILPQLAGQKQIGPMIREARQRDGRTIKELALATGASASQLSNWELRNTIPTLENREIVGKLDKELNYGGDLIAAWLAQNPRACNLQARHYALRPEDFPQALQNDIDAFFAYKASNPLQLSRNQKREWRPGSKRVALGFFTRFYGYLVNVKNFAKHNLTIYLLLEWPFVVGWLDFVKKRTGRTQYNETQQILVRNFMSWIPYFNNFWADAVADPYWRNHLPTTLSVPSKLPGVPPTVQVLTTPQQQWAAVTLGTVDKAKSFLKNNVFDNRHLLKLGREFLKSKLSLADVVPIIVKELARLPKKITRMRDAIQMRRLAICSMIIIRAFRLGTFQRMQLEHVPVQNGKAAWNIPPSAVKNHRSIEGDLGDFWWAHEAICRYLEVRSMLIGGGKDEGHFFVTIGGGVNDRMIYDDVKRILGVAPHELRYIVATILKREGRSDEELAQVLADTAAMVRKAYEQTDAEDHNSVANKAMESLFNAKKGKK